ncbi:MAG: tetratricopeptide repeat protein [Fuerstiella sp.]
MMIETQNLVAAPSASASLANTFASPASFAKARTMSNLCRSLCLVQAALIAFVFGSAAPTASGVTPSGFASADLESEIPGAYKVTIQQVLLKGISTLDRLQGNVSVEVTVQNLSDVSMTLNLSQIKAKCAERLFSVTASRQQPLITRTPITIEPQKTATGWLGFAVYHASSDEPKISLKFDIDEQVLDLSINDAIRKTSACSWKPIGPNGMLAVIDLQRPVDGFATWILAKTFQQVKNSGIERVIVNFIPVKDTWAVSSNSISINSVDAWLQSAIDAPPTNARLPFASAVKAPVKFNMLHVVQPSTYRRPAYGFADIRKPDLPSAIAASLRDVFQVIPADELESAFTSPIAGIRRAAMETNLDRLSDARLQQIFESAVDDTSQQKLLATQLYRSASPIALRLLEQLARNKDPDVSQAAIESIIKSASEKAVPAALALWRDFEGDANWETDFAEAILKQDDYRFTVVLAAFAERRLMSLTSHTEAASSPQQSTTTPRLSPLEILGQQRNAASSSLIQRTRRQKTTLPRVLAFLRQQENREFEDVAVRQLLKIRDPSVQDDVLQYILSAKSVRVQQLVADYIEQRLPKIPTAEGELSDEELRRLQQKYSPKGIVPSSRYSIELFQTIKRFPKPHYTTRLLQLADDNTLNSSARTSAFVAAFHGATPKQIDSILEDFDDLTRIRRTQALDALLRLNHPRWLEFAKISLEISPDAAQDTLRLLQRDRSLEAALIMVKFLDKVRKEAELRASGNVASNAQFNRQVSTFSPSLYQVNHPESKAYLNRLEKSPLIQFHNIARQTKYSGVMNSRRGQLNRQADQLKADGKNSQAEEIYRQIIDSDPFNESAMISLASLCMRSDRPKEAMELLQRAIKISPEDVQTESFIALAMIRLGDVEGGIRRTEETLKDVPDLATPLRINALYNTACAYSRASEKAANDEQRKQFVKDAFRFLNLSIDREVGFTDYTHALADPDLTALQKESDWKTVIAKMKAKAGQVQP